MVALKSDRHISPTSNQFEADEVISNDTNMKHVFAECTLDD